MNEMIKSYNKPYFIASFLLFLSLADAMFTDFGLRQQVIIELNPIMNSIYYSSLLFFYLIKIGLPLLLLLSLPYAITSRLVKHTLTIALFLYSGVFIYHIGWVSYVYFIM